jgi:hypothetical protein
LDYQPLKKLKESTEVSKNRSYENKKQEENISKLRELSISEDKSDSLDGDDDHDTNKSVMILLNNITKNLLRNAVAFRMLDQNRKNLEMQKSYPKEN